MEQSSCWSLITDGRDVFCFPLVNLVTWFRLSRWQEVELFSDFLSSRSNNQPREQSGKKSTASCSSVWLMLYRCNKLQPTYIRDILKSHSHQTLANTAQECVQELVSAAAQWWLTSTINTEIRKTKKNKNKKQIHFRIDFFFILLLFFTNNLSVTKTVFPARIKKHFRISKWSSIPPPLHQRHRDSLPCHTKVQLQLKTASLRVGREEEATLETIFQLWFFTWLWKKRNILGMI